MNEDPRVALHAAITEYVREVTDSPGRMVTDFVFCSASVDLAEAPGRTYYTSLSTGAPHSARGLVLILDECIDEITSLEDGDEEED